MNGLECKIVSATPDPGITSYVALHQDYSEGYSIDEVFKGEGYTDPFYPGGELEEEEATRRVIDHCLKHSHFGVIEHPQIVLNFKGFPHSTMQQLRTHRTGISFDVQSGRFTGNRIIKVADGELPVEEVFWCRPPGEYSDRWSKRYKWRPTDCDCHYTLYRSAAEQYAYAVRAGMPKEMARDLYIPHGIRQNFVMSANLRTIFHLADMRSPKDAEYEIRLLVDLMLECVREWAPGFVDYYMNTRYQKNKLAP